MLQARSIRANNSPPNKLPKGLVSPGKTISVKIVKDSLGDFAVMLINFQQRYGYFIK
jgi:hypothetical protein